MPHIHVTAPHPTFGGRGQLIIDGHDLSEHILADPFHVDIGDPQAGIPPTVTVTIVADEGLDLDLLDGVLQCAITDTDTE